MSDPENTLTKRFPGGQPINFTGKKVNMLTPIRCINNFHKSGNRVWECRCDCGSLVNVSTSNLSTKRQKSCGCISNAKKYSHLTKAEYKKKYSEMWKRTRINTSINVECPKCHHIRNVYKINYKRNNFTKKCFECSVKERNGENHNWYKNGNSKNIPLYGQIRKLFKNYIWKAKVQNRDAGICQVCFGDGYLVHHLEPFQYIIEKNKIETIEEATKCKELFDVTNGLLVCKDCHKELHEYRKMLGETI